MKCLFSITAKHEYIIYMLTNSIVCYAIQFQLLEGKPSAKRFGAIKNITFFTGKSRVQIQP